MPSARRLGLPETSTASRLSPEAQLLCFALPGRPVGQASLQSLLDQGVDCEKLVSLAHRNRMTLCLFDMLSRNGLSISGLEAYRAEARAEAAASAAHLAESLRLLRVFEHASIAVVPYKGAILDQQLYGGRGLRQAGDIDLLVPRDSFERAQQVLTTTGYRPAVALTDRQRRRCARTVRETAYVSVDGLHSVDLHWSLHPHGERSPQATRAVLSRTAATGIDGRPVRVLSQEDHFFALILHGNRHAWERLSWLCDVALYLRDYPEMDWDVLLQRARDARAVRALSLALALSSEVLGVLPPRAVAAHMPVPLAPPGLVERVVSRIFGVETPALTGLESVKFRLTTSDSPRRQALEMARLWLTLGEADFRLVDLPTPLFPAYYIIRPVRLTVKALRADPWLA